MLKNSDLGELLKLEKNTEKWNIAPYVWLAWVLYIINSENRKKGPSSVLSTQKLRKQKIIDV